MSGYLGSAQYSGVTFRLYRSTPVAYVAYVWHPSRGIVSAKVSGYKSLVDSGQVDSFSAGCRSGHIGQRYISVLFLVVALYHPRMAHHSHGVYHGSPRSSECHNIPLRRVQPDWPPAQSTFLQRL